MVTQSNLQILISRHRTSSVAKCGSFSHFIFDTKKKRSILYADRFKISFDLIEYKSMYENVCHFHRNLLLLERKRRQ